MANPSNVKGHKLSKQASDNVKDLEKCEQWKGGGKGPAQKDVRWQRPEQIGQVCRQGGSEVQDFRGKVKEREREERA